MGLTLGIINVINGDLLLMFRGEGFNLRVLRVLSLMVGISVSRRSSSHKELWKVVKMWVNKFV